MAELKTRKTDIRAETYLGAISDELRQADCRKLVRLMQKVSGAPPRMWGSSIVGFGERPMRYASGREMSWPVLGFSSRKAGLTLYLTCDIAAYQSYLDKLGKHRTGKGCLYLRRLADVDFKALEALLRASMG